jgi:aspartyl-tRNA(Asn)/glutamyl-tRNA(Gln) amidotransferase subunit A
MSEITAMQIWELSERLQARELSSVEVTEAYLREIERRDRVIGAYITVCAEEALKMAEESDRRRTVTGRMPVLAGIPAGIKDNILTKGVKTTCASKMLGDFVPPYSATVVEKLLGMDFVMLGKLNMDEFAMGSSNENSFFGPVRNPRCVDRVAGGSSGGPAAAVSANEAAFALGSDTGGSVRQPAAFCGVVGMKPTYGTVSRYGLVAFASSLDQIGPITGCVRDNALVLNALAGHDPRDATSAARDHGDFTRGLDLGVKGMKIALLSGLPDTGVSPEVRSGIISAASAFREMGAEITEVSLSTLEYALPAYYVISSSEASSNLARFDAVGYGCRSGNSDNIEDLYCDSRSEGFGSEVKRRILLGTFALSSGYFDAYYKKALQVRSLVMKEFSDVFGYCDMILSPVTAAPAYMLGEMTSDPVEMYMGDMFTVPASLAGLPALSLPCSKTEEGLPVGMQLIGKPFSEALLYRAAYAFEQSHPIKLDIDRRCIDGGK